MLSIFLRKCKELIKSNGVKRRLSGVKIHDSIGADELCSDLLCRKYHNFRYLEPTREI